MASESALLIANQIVTLCSLLLASTDVKVAATS